MVAEYEITIPLPGKYNERLIIDNYNGRYSLALGQESKDGRIFAKWVYPQVRKDKVSSPAEKAIPLQIPLGTWDEAVEVVKQLAAAFQINLSMIQSGEVPGDDSEIPF